VDITPDPMVCYHIPDNREPHNYFIVVIPDNPDSGTESKPRRSSCWANDCYRNILPCDSCWANDLKLRGGEPSVLAA